VQEGFAEAGGLAAIGKVTRTSEAAGP